MDSRAQQGISRAFHAPPTLPSSPHAAAVVAQHQRPLDVVGHECMLLRVAEHVLEQREHALARGRVGRDRKDDPRRLGPLRDLVAVVGPPLGAA